jgi:hypothetical protein
VYGLEERAGRIRVYEHVLREGIKDDGRFYVDADELREVFDERVAHARPAGVEGLARPAA